MNRSVKIILFTPLAGFAAGLMALTTSAQTEPVLGNLPLYFEAGQGQTNAPAQFIARGPDSQFLISSDEAQMALRKSTSEIAAVRMQFIGANPSAQVEGTSELAGKINYLVGNDPAQWRSGVPTFAKVSVADIYPGIGLIYYGNQQRLEYDFTIAPGANPNAIAIRFEGPEKIYINAQGELVLDLGDDKISQLKPLIYQTIDGMRQTVDGGYQIIGTHTVAFSIGQYDRTLPLVIDPILSFSTYFGGSADETGWGVAVNTNDGSIYIAGQTLSKNFYNTPGAFQTNFAGGNQAGDAFVAKFNNSGQSLLYLTYLGGSADDAAYSLAVDGAGNAYIAGATDSTNFPTTNAIYPKISGVLNEDFGVYMADAFVAELNPSGSNLIYSTYLGGGAPDVAYGIAVDASGNAYVTGSTYSTNFPTTNAIQNRLACTYSQFYNANAFVTEIAAGGTNLVFSTYFGGTNFDQGQGIAVDGSGNIYVTGYTDSTNFPTWNTPTNLPGGRLLNGATNNAATFDAFVTKFPPFSTNWIRGTNNNYSISNLVYSTFLGGTNIDVGRSIACDADGDAFVAGYSTSTNFPDTVTNIPGLFSYVATNNVGALATNAFLTEINSNGTTMVYSALFGGPGADVASGVAVDAVGDAFVIGSATSTNFPTTNTVGNLAATNSGLSDVFVTAFSTNATTLLYSAYVGGNANDYGYGIALDSMDNAYIVGQTLSSNFPTNAANQAKLNGSSDAFVAEIVFSPLPPQIITQPTNLDVGVGSTATFNVTATGATPLSFQWQLDGTNLTNGTYISGANSTGISANSTLTINNAQTTNSGNYTVVVSNGAGMVTSSNAVLTVTNTLPLITTQPVSQTNEVGAGSVGGYIDFSISETPGTPPESYQWVKDGTNLDNGGTNFSTDAIAPLHIYGATNNELYIVDPQTNDEGTYWLVITNPAGVVTSSNATLTVVSFPTIVTTPTNQTVGLGSSVTFVVYAVGTGTLGYQWQYNGTTLTDGTNTDGSIISGSTNASLTLNNAQTTDDGGYSVIVTNTLGSVTSSPPAVLTVLTVPTFMGITAGTNGSFIFSGTGGTNGGTYLVYASTNLALPLSQWQPVSVNGSQFGSQGQFTFTNTPPANITQRFYILLLPSP